MSSHPSERLVRAHERQYSEKAFWRKLPKVAKRLGLHAAFYALALYYILTSGKVSLRDKAYIAGALGYLIVPLDLLPDVIPVLGFTDDISALLMVYTKVKANLTPELRTRAQEQLREWFGPDVTLPE